MLNAYLLQLSANVPPKTEVTLIIIIVIILQTLTPFNGAENVKIKVVHAVTVVDHANVLFKN
jgi:hypothetical protein